ncbi:hypothetical protein VSDG_08115 [Cytospora chrysosperma]|uniref:UEV domain-containing protein n=1 Tax=Cytospora chrysosperma TaxID=252740 RepID=A0A423VFB7_CYTCH|nr:hypothetical protein VSDG_08115 [Valsa sordida]
MVVQQHVLNWLYSVLTSALSHYSSLSPRTDVHTFPNGSSALLLHIAGTLPVTFRGTTYRFPVSIWIPHAYPREPPLVYVTPTEAMIVRPGQHVDPQGQVYHPYLVGWADFWDKSNLLDFLAILRDIFAKEPPVIARGQAQRPPSTQPQATPTPPPIPPLPQELSARPPSIVHSPPTCSSSSSSRGRRKDILKLGLLVPNQRIKWLQFKTNSMQARLLLCLPPIPMPPQVMPPQIQQKPSPPPDLMDEPLTLDIPSPSSVAPPPIPPNPEKDVILRQLASTLHQMRTRVREQNDSSLQGLQAQRTAMLSAMSAMQQEVGGLTQLSNFLRNNTAILHDIMRRADETIENSKRLPEPDVDQLLVAPTVVGNQLYEAVAEERALADAIFVLSRAVERGRVAPAVFAKTTRSLAREWYLKKALVKKIGRGMGLSAA